MLLQNGFGRSVLTEAFESKNSDAIAVCLNHKTASEERLIPNSKKSDTGEGVFKFTTEDGEQQPGTKSSGDGESGAVSHEFHFRIRSGQAQGGGEGEASPLVVRVRELPIEHADTPFGSDSTPDQDTTGLAIWPASILLSQWLCREWDSGSLFPRDAGAGLQGGNRECVCMELGAGCGLPGLSLALHSLPSEVQSTVYITDIHPASIDNCKHNLRINGYQEAQSVPQPGNPDLPESATYVRQHPGHSGRSSTVVVQYMAWGEPATYPALHPQVDVILGSDLVYEIRILGYLIPTLLQLLKIGNTVAG